MQDYSYDVPVFGGAVNRSLRVNALDVVHNTHCRICLNPLRGAVLAIGAPYSMLLHRTCVHNVNYSAGWQHEFPATYYREQAFASHIPRNANASEPQRANEGITSTLDVMQIDKN